MHSTAEVFVTTILLKGCNLSHFLLQCQVYAYLGGGLASFFTLLPTLSCFLHSIFYSFAQSEPFLRNIVSTFPKFGAPSAGEKSLLRLLPRTRVTTTMGEKVKTRAKTIDGMGKKIPFERTLESKIYPIRLWGRETCYNPWYNISAAAPCWCAALDEKKKGKKLCRGVVHRDWQTNDALELLSR